MKFSAQPEIVHFHERQFWLGSGFFLLLQAGIQGAKLPRSQPPVGVHQEWVHDNQARIKRIPVGILSADRVRPRRAGIRLGGITEAGDGLGAHG